MAVEQSMKNYNEAVARIAGHINVKEGNPMVVASCILACHVNRTKAHIAAVQKFARAVASKFRLRPWAVPLVDRVKYHDYDKIHDLPFMGDYAPYIIKKYGPKWLKDMFKVNESYPKEWETVYIVQHIKKSSHHPEHWCEEYDFGENTPPYDVTKMDAVSLVEMLADWMAVGLEKGNTASEWNKTTGKERYIFSTEQIALIESILSFEEEFRKAFAKK